MYDDLIGRMQKKANEFPKTGEVNPLLFEAADAIEELQGKNFLMKKTAEWVAEKVPKWIPVTEQPPLQVGDDGYNGYLVYANGYYEIADYTIDKLDDVPCFHVNGEYEANVTHFMPLPEPPKEE